MSDEKQGVKFLVIGEPPIQAIPALYSNFLGVSRVGTDVQFEFVFIDLNFLGSALAATKGKNISSPLRVNGKTVAKIVMPAITFLQVQEQLEKVIAALKEEMSKVHGVTDEQQRSGSVG